MAVCPRCQRPLAVAQPRCVYCGAPIDPSSLPPPPRVTPEAAPPAEDRILLLIHAGGSDGETLARALGVPAFEAEQRRRRGGWHLHRIGTSAVTEPEAALLRASGLVVALVPEAQVRPATQPRLVEGGRGGPEGIDLRTADGPQPLAPGEVILVVAGSIYREKQRADFSAKRPSMPLDAAFRFHVHLRADPRPLEIGPDGFTFDDRHRTTTSSLLELRSWLEPLAAIDDGFRLESPAFGVAMPIEGRADLSRALGRPGLRDPKGPAVLDNLAQFRFYSGWRGALERRPRG